MSFVRREDDFSEKTRDKRTTLVAKLENYYKNLASEGQERNQRYGVNNLEPGSNISDLPTFKPR